MAWVGVRHDEHVHVISLAFVEGDVELCRDVHPDFVETCILMG